MGLRNILVHLDSNERTQERLKLAASLAKAHQARLVGVFAQRAKPYTVGVVTNWPPEDYVAAAAASRAAFEEAAKSLAKSEWIDLHRGSDPEIVQQIGDLSRHFDLIILGQIKLEGEQLTPPDMIEEIIVESGRPVLVVPFVGHYDHVGQRPLFAWTDTATAARAFSGALSLVSPGADALVVAIAKPGEDQKLTYQKQSLDLAVEHLEAHGVAGKSEQLLISDIGLMDTLLNRASDHYADLLALGAFGGSGYPLFSRGSGSRFMLKHMTLPILFSH